MGWNPEIRAGKRNGGRNECPVEGKVKGGSAENGARPHKS